MLDERGGESIYDGLFDDPLDFDHCEELEENSGNELENKEFSDELENNLNESPRVMLLAIPSRNDGADEAPGEFTTVQTIDDTGAPASGNCQPHTREEFKQKLSASGKYDQTAEVCITSRAFQQKTCSTCGEPGHNKTSCNRKRKRQ